MMARYEIYHRETGSLGENDEYWTLVVPERGKPMVRHTCLWGNPYRGEVKHPAPTDTPLTEFLAEHTFGIVHDKLTHLLRQLQINLNSEAPR